ncbi:MAG: inverse autotransporter beta domain-containing protein [Chlamydiota bacterium]
MKKLCLFLFCGLIATAPLTIRAAASFQELNTISPEWLKRVEFQGHTQDRYDKPTWSIETVQPLYATPETLRHTVFMQGRAGIRYNYATLNIGGGYRYLLPQENWLVGGNVFYDVTRQYYLRTLTLGAEAIGRYITLRGFHQQSAGSSTTAGSATLKPMDKWDLGVELPTPFLPWARLLGRYYHANAKYGSDSHGFLSSLQMDLTKYMSAEIGNYSSNTSSNNYIMIALRTGQPKSSPYNLLDDGFSKKFCIARDLKNYNLDKVRLWPRCVGINAEIH